MNYIRRVIFETIISGEWIFRSLDENSSLNNLLKNCKLQNMSHVQTKTKVLSDKTYKHVTGTAEYRRNQFSLLKRRPQNIVHRLEHRFHEVTLWENIPRSFVSRHTVTYLSQNKNYIQICLDFWGYNIIEIYFKERSVKN